MPIYEYRCNTCGKTFEALQKFSDDPFTLCGQAESLVCEHNREGKVERLLSSPSFQFKGSGFYITDYAKSGSSSSSGKGSDSKSGESKSSDSKPSDSGTKKSESSSGSSSTKSD